MYTKKVAAGGRFSAFMLGVLGIGSVALTISPLVPTVQAQSGGTLVSDPSLRSAILKDGRALDPFLRSGDAHSIFRKFSPQMAQAIPESSVQQILQETLSQGPIGDRLGESVRTDSYGDGIYEAEYSWDGAIEYLEADFDGNEQIAGLLIKGLGALQTDPNRAYQTKGTYHLPFSGTWWIFWGGNTDIQNAHVVAPDQRHAYDIVIAKNGSDFHGTPDNNSNYYDFGQRILSPCDATVVEAVDGIAENIPGTMNANQPFGNHVVLDCGGGEYLVMAHFKDHSLKVRKGDKVSDGQLIALCGNTGNSSEPHLHIHLQNGPVLSSALGLPLAFSSYIADGNSVSKGELLQAQYVRTAN